MTSPLPRCLLFTTLVSIVSVSIGLMVCKCISSYSSPSLDSIAELLSSGWQVLNEKLWLHVYPAFLVWLSFTLYSFKESTDEFHYPVAGTMLGMDTTVSMSTDSGPKDVIGKEKRMPGCYGVTEGKLSSLPWITRMRMRRKNFKPKKTYVHRFRGKGMLGKARNLENSWRLPE